MSEDALQIEIDGEVTLEQLTKILAATNGLLRELAREITEIPMRCVGS